MSSLSPQLLQRYNDWLPTRQYEDVDTDEVRQRVLDGLRFAKSMTSKEYTLWRTWLQVNEQFDRNNKSQWRKIQKVKRNIYIPEGPEDVETLEPELLFVHQQFPVPRVSIWGTERIAFLTHPDSVNDDWEIMRHFVSNMEYSGNVGRSLRFLVRDKNTKRYLGFIGVSGDYANLKGRDDAIGWKKNTKKKGMPDRLNNSAVGSVLVPTQPFGFSFLGGKLMALLLMSRPVAQMWERYYGDILVSVSTTSLHASQTEVSQYSGLGKYMKSFGRSPGETALRPDRETLALMKKWMLKNYPQQYWEYYVATRQNGQPLRRSANEFARQFCYKALGIHQNEYRSGHSRGVYFSRLYSNTDEFLRGEIDADALKPKFDNSVEALTEVWRQKARKRAEKLGEDGTFLRETYFTDQLVGMSWEDAKATYLR